MSINRSLFMTLAEVIDGVEGEDDLRMTKTAAAPEKDRPDRALSDPRSSLPTTSAAWQLRLAEMQLMTKTKAKPEQDRPDRWP